jgi:hypothetical protein
MVDNLCLNQPPIYRLVLKGTYQIFLFGIFNNLNELSAQHVLHAAQFTVK